MKFEAIIKLFNYIDDNHKDCLWYGGDIAEIQYRGYSFYIGAYGDVRCSYYSGDRRDIESRELVYVKDKSNLGYFYGEMKHYIANDEELLAAIDTYQLCVDNNNWFEFYVVSPEGNVVDIGLDTVLDSLKIDEAVFEVLDMMDDVIESEVRTL